MSDGSIGGGSSGPIEYSEISHLDDLNKLYANEKKREIDDNEQLGTVRIREDFLSDLSEYLGLDPSASVNILEQVLGYNFTVTKSPQAMYDQPSEFSNETGNGLFTQENYGMDTHDFDVIAALEGESEGEQDLQTMAKACETCAKHNTRARAGIASLQKG